MCAPRLPHLQVGAINCEKPANKRLCADWLAVDSYPSLLLLNHKHGTLARYPKDGDKGARAVAAWALETAREWRHLFLRSSVRALDTHSFDEAVMQDEERVWIVRFADGSNAWLPLLPLGALGNLRFPLIVLDCP